MSVPAELGLNARQESFVSAFVDCGDILLAARAAGYTDSNVAQLRIGLMRRPEVLAAIHLAVARKLQEAAPVALQLVESIVRDTAAPVKVRLDAAKVLLDRAGHIAPRARAAGEGSDKTLGEMSLDELKATQERLEGEILARAKVVSQQNDTATNDQDVDLLG